MSYQYDIQDMNLTSAVEFTNTSSFSDVGQVLNITEEGGSEHAHIVIEIPSLSAGSGLLATVQESDTIDGTFTDTSIAVEGADGEAVVKRERIPLGMKKYIRLKVTTGVTMPGGSGTAKLTVRV